MAVIIRLQNLAWSATAPDVRKFFSGLSIPNGGVHIVGGDDGDCFVAFATDEDARKAMKLDGGRLANQKVKLLLSSKAEMEEIIAIARGEKPAHPPASTSASSVVSAPSREPSREPSRHRSRSRSPRRSNVSPDRSRSSRRDAYSRDMDRSGANRSAGSRSDVRGVPSAIARGVDEMAMSADLREAHRREIAKVDPLPSTGPSQSVDRRVLLQSSADALNSSGTHAKLYGGAGQLPNKERSTQQGDVMAQMSGNKMPGGQAVLSAVSQITESRWREDTSAQMKSPSQSDSSHYSVAMPPSGALDWGSSVALPPPADRPVHRKSADGWPSAGQPLQTDPRGTIPSDPHSAFARSFGAAFSPQQAGNGVPPPPPPASLSKGRSGHGGSRPPALLPTPPEPVLRPQLEPEVGAQLPAGLGGASDQLGMRRGPPPRVAGAAPYDSSAAALPFDAFDRPAAGTFERASTMSFDRSAISTFNHEHGVQTMLERTAASGYDVLGPAFDLPEARPYPPAATAVPNEPAVRIFNLGPLATKKGLRAFFAKSGVHPVDIKLVRRWHGDNVVGFLLFSSVSEATAVVANMTGLAFEEGQPLGFEPCSRAEYEAVAEHGAAMPATRDSPSQLCVTFTDIPPTATIKDLEELLAQTEYVVPSLYLEHDASGICTGTAYVEMGNVHDYETVLAMRKRVAIHGQIIRVRPINKDEMKALVVHHKDSLLALSRDVVMYPGGAEMVQQPPLSLEADVFRHSPGMPGSDRHQRFMGAAGDDLGSSLPVVAEGSIPLLMNPPTGLLGPDRGGIVLHLTDLPAECSIGRLIDFLQPAPISPNYVRVLAFPDGSCSGEAFVKVFHPHDADMVLQCDRRLWAGQLVRVWKSSEKYMEEAVTAFESQFVDYDSGRSVHRARGEPLLERPPRWRPRYEGHDGLPAL